MIDVILGYRIEDSIRPYIYLAPYNLDICMLIHLINMSILIVPTFIQHKLACIIRYNILNRSINSICYLKLPKVDKVNRTGLRNLYVNKLLC